VPPPENWKLKSVSACLIFEFFSSVIPSRSSHVQRPLWIRPIRPPTNLRCGGNQASHLAFCSLWEVRVWCAMPSQ